ncbi:MAG: hypothetical protein ACJA0B_001497 [Alcanivorax borkumensis]|jgi:hypothetical protein
MASSALRGFSGAIKKAQVKDSENMMLSMACAFFVWWSRREAPP